jgi:hypothetical protein
MDKKDIAIAIGCGFLVGLAGSLIVRSIKKPKKQSKTTDVPTHQINTSDVGIDLVEEKEQHPTTTSDAEIQEPVLDQHEEEEEFPDPAESSKKEDFENAELPPPIRSEDDHDSESTPTSEKEEIH